MQLSSDDERRIDDALSSAKARLPRSQAEALETLAEEFKDANGEQADTIKSVLKPILDADTGNSFGL